MVIRRIQERKAEFYASTGVTATVVHLAPAELIALAIEVGLPQAQWPRLQRVLDMEIRVAQFPGVSLSGCQ